MAGSIMLSAIFYHQNISFGFLFFETNITINPDNTNIGMIKNG